MQKYCEMSRFDKQSVKMIMILTISLVIGWGVIIKGSGLLY